MRTRIFVWCVGLLAPIWLASPCRAADGVPAARNRDEVKAILKAAHAAPAERTLDVVLVAGPKDHGPNEHDYPLWQKRWKVLLGGLAEGDEPFLNTYGPPAPADEQDLAGAENVRVTTAWQWPTAEQWDAAELVVINSAPPWTPERLAQIEAYLQRGGGLAVIHMTVWHGAPELVPLFGITQKRETQFRHGPVLLELPDRTQGICLGLPAAFELVDESYFNFRTDLAGADVLATCKETRPGETAPRDEPIFWTRPHGRGRVFACIPGHYMWTFDDPLFRILLLRGMAWAAGESPYRFDPLVLRGARVARPVTAQKPDANDPDLLLWLDASDKETLSLDEGLVSRWQNKAAKFDRALASEGAARPRWVADAMAGRPAVRFDGQDDVLRAKDFQGEAAQWTLFLVTTPRSNRGSGIPAGFHGFFSANAPGGQDYVTGINVDMGGVETTDFTCLNVEGAKGGGAVNLLSEGFEFGQPHVLAIATDNQLTTVYVDSAAQGFRGANDAAASLAEIRVGARCYHHGQETGFVDADVAEVILYRKYLSETQIAAVSRYLQDKYPIAARDEPATLDDALAALAAYDWGHSRRALVPIDDAIRSPNGGAGDLEERLADVLQKGVSPCAADFICRRLALIGTARGVPALAELLADPDRAAMARYALEQIPAKEAGEALLDALPDAKGSLRVEIIHSLGRRRCAAAAPRLLEILRAEEGPPADAALAALAELGEPGTVAPILARRGVPADVLLVLAQRLLEHGDKDAAGEIYDSLERPGAAVPEQVAAAILQGRVALDPDRATERLLPVLKGDDARLRGQAVSLLTQTAPEAAAADAVNQFDALPLAARRALLAADWRRFPALGRKAVLAGLGGDDPAVQCDALSLIIHVGTAEDVSLLARVAADAPPPVRDAAELALKHLAAEGTDRAIIDQLARVPAARLVLVRAARERRSRGAVPVLLELSQSTDEAVRLASLAALGVLGDSSTVEPLVARLLAAGTSQERAAAERAVWLCAQKGDEPDRRADAVLAAIEKSSGRDLAALLPVLGRIGAPRALAVIRDAVKNPDPAVHRAAVTALANWPDATVAAELLDLAKNEEHEASRVRALRGYIRVVTLRDVRPDDQTLAMLRPAVALASRLEEKRLIVSRLAAVVTPDSLELAASHLDEPELRKEAISTCVSLAEALLPSHPEPAKAAMRRVLAVTTDQAVRARLERHLKKTQ